MFPLIPIVPVVFGAFVASFCCSGHANDLKPLPVPPQIRILSSQPRAEVVSVLTKNQKKLAYHLLRAAEAGRPILFFQNHRWGLELKGILENAFQSETMEQTRAIVGSEEAFQELLHYAAKFFENSGPYEGANRKYVLTKVTADAARRLVCPAGVCAHLDVDEIVRLMTAPDYEVQRMPETSHGEELHLVGGNLYEKGITGAEVKAYLEGGGKIDVNCRMVRNPETQKIECEKQTTRTPGPVGEALRKVVRHLALALGYSETEHQKSQLIHLIRYFEEGNEEDFRQASIDWVKDRGNSVVDFMIGFVEVYEDYNARMGSWESYVQILDPKTTELSLKLAKNAQYFEDKMPYGEFKKKFPADYSPPALIVYYLHEHSSMRTAGYNLPNYDDIRRDVGAKNIIRQDLPGFENDPIAKEDRREMYQEFLVASKVDELLEYGPRAKRLKTLLHEVIGHGSGTYDVSKFGEKQDPVSAMGSPASSLEEQRADLTALVFGADPKLVEAGIFSNQQEADRILRALYDDYMADFLRNLAKNRSFAQAHHRGRWLFINKLIEGGAVEWTSRDGTAMTNANRVLNVKDYELFHRIAFATLEELQRVKATRQEAEMRALFAKYAPLDAIDESWAQAVIERGAKLRMSYGTVEQPWKLNRKGRVKTFGDASSMELIAPYWAACATKPHLCRD